MTDHYDQNEPCFFCTVSSDRFLADNEHFYAVLDEFPVSPGHMLVVSKIHTASIKDLPVESGVALLTIIQQLAANIPVDTMRDFYTEGTLTPKNAISKELCQAALAMIDENTEYKDFNLGVNDGARAGQTVPHLHIHIMPRFANDGGAGVGGIRHIFPDKGSYKHA